MSVHDASLDLEPLLPSAGAKQLEHRGRLIDRNYLRAESGRGNAEGTASTGDVQKPRARANARTPQALAGYPHLAGSIRLVVARRDCVPFGARVVVARAHDISPARSEPASGPSAARNASTNASGRSSGEIGRASCRESV